MDDDTRHYHPTSSKKTSARALVAIAIILALMTVFSIIAGGVAFGHWWSAKIPAACCTAAKTTYTIIFRETDIGSCPLTDDVCDTPGADFIYNGTLVSASDGSTVVGYTIGSCITIGEALGYATSPDYIELCQQEYIFNGEGGITAGKLMAEGSYFVPSDATSYLLTTWAVTGGTGPYHFPNGGQLTYTTTVDPTYIVVTVSEIVVN